MFTVTVKNAINEELQLTQNESEYQLINIEGLNPPNADIHTTTIYGMDGALFNSSKLNTRELVLYIRLNGNVAEQRLKLYNLFRTKEKCTINYKSSIRDVFIEGYASTVEVSPFDNQNIFQVAILCPQPYFQSVIDIVQDASSVINKFQFPFAIDYNSPIVISEFETNKINTIMNNSEVETGFLAAINVNNTFQKIIIRNVVSGEQIGLSDTFIKGDIITIDTNKGSKSVRLFRNGVDSNLFTKVIKNSVFFQLKSGMNNLAYQINNSDEFNHYVSVQFTFRERYRGV